MGEDADAPGDRARTACPSHAQGRLPDAEPRARSRTRGAVLAGGPGPGPGGRPDGRRQQRQQPAPRSARLRSTQAGIACDIGHVPGATSPGKVAQLRAYGATVHLVEGTREEFGQRRRGRGRPAWRLLRQPRLQPVLPARREDLRLRGVGAARRGSSPRPWSCLSATALPSCSAATSAARMSCWPEASSTGSPAARRGCRPRVRPARPGPPASGLAGPVDVRFRRNDRRGTPSRSLARPAAPRILAAVADTGWRLACRSTTNRSATPTADDWRWPGLYVEPTAAVLLVPPCRAEPGRGRQGRSGTSCARPRCAAAASNPSHLLSLDQRCRCWFRPGGRFCSSMRPR